MAQKVIGHTISRILLVFAVVILVFFLLRLSAGDPALIKAGLWASEDIVQQYREDFGTDKSIFEQFITFLGQLSRGDLGVSFRYREPNLALIGRALPYTLLLACMSLTIIVSVSMVVGTLSAVYPRSLIDRFGLALAVFGQSLPVFWLGLMAVLVFSVKLSLLPSTGYSGLKSLILPAAVVAITELPWQLRVVRASMTETLSQDYIRTARAFGIRERRILFVYALRNSAIPILTTLGVQIGYLLGGAVVAEVVFNYPGMGKLFLSAVQQRDYPLVQAITIVSATLFIFINLLIDIAYTFIDPRIRT